METKPSHPAFVSTAGIPSTNAFARLLAPQTKAHAVKHIFAICTILLLGSQCGFAQGYIVPNGVVTNLFPGEIDVWNPGSQITGFTLAPSGESEPTGFPNIFVFDEPVTYGVRVFLLSANDPISLQAIQSQSYPEPSFGSSLELDVGTPFYVGLYTGFNFAPPYPPYPPYTYLDPVFGWAELVNDNGIIEVMDSAVEYQGGGIIAGTLNIIPVPEPATLALFATSAFLLALRRKPRSRNCATLRS